MNQKILSKIFAIKTDMPSIKKDGSNPHFKNKYASLDNIMDVIEPLLQKNKVLLYHTQESGKLITILCDVESSEQLQTAYPIDETLDNQKIGSALTYGRRYSICLLLGIVADEDDDGNGTKKTAPHPAPTKQEPQNEGAKRISQATKATKDLDAEIKSCVLETTYEGQLSRLNELENRWRSGSVKLIELGVYVSGLTKIGDAIKATTGQTK